MVHYRLRTDTEWPLPLPCLYLCGLILSDTVRAIHARSAMMSLGGGDGVGGGGGCAQVEGVLKFLTLKLVSTTEKNQVVFMTMMAMTMTRKELRGDQFASAKRLLCRLLLSLLFVDIDHHTATATTVAAVPSSLTTTTTKQKQIHSAGYAAAVLRGASVRLLHGADRQLECRGARRFEVDEGGADWLGPRRRGTFRCVAAAWLVLDQSLLLT